MKLDGKVVVITGAGRGIGRALAVSFAREGARLSLCSRTQKELNETRVQAVQVSPQGEAAVWAKTCDIADRATVALWIKETARRFERIDVLVNNAGLLGVRQSVADYPDEIWQEVLRVNVTGTYFVTKAVLNESMLSQRSDRAGAPAKRAGEGSAESSGEDSAGLILNIASGVGRVGKANWGAYALSKFALEGFNQLLANELSAAGIISIAVNPEGTRTPMRAHAYPQEDPNTLKTPDEFANALVDFIPRVSAADSGKSYDYKDLKK